METVAWNISLFMEKFFNLSEHWYVSPSFWSVFVRVFARDKKCSFKSYAVKAFSIVSLLEDVLARALKEFQIKEVLLVWLDTILSTKKAFFACLTEYFTSLLCFFKFRVVLLFLDFIPSFHGLLVVACETGRQCEVLEKNVCFNAICPIRGMLVIDWWEHFVEMG